MLNRHGAACETLATRMPLKYVSMEAETIGGSCAIQVAWIIRVAGLGIRTGDDDLWRAQVLGYRRTHRQAHPGQVRRSRRHVPRYSEHLLRRQRGKDPR